MEVIRKGWSSAPDKAIYRNFRHEELEVTQIIHVEATGTRCTCKVTNPYARVSRWKELYAESVTEAIELLDLSKDELLRSFGKEI